MSYRFRVKYERIEGGFGSVIVNIPSILKGTAVTYESAKVEAASNVASMMPGMVKRVVKVAEVK
jgi:hypothetical protein